MTGMSDGLSQMIPFQECYFTNNIQAETFSIPINLG